MPIVINDFEIIVEPPKQQEQTKAADAAPLPQQAQLRPVDIEEILRRRRERGERVRAN